MSSWEIRGVPVGSGGVLGNSGDFGEVPGGSAMVLGFTPLFVQLSISSFV